MTTPSFNRAIGISVIVSSPLWTGGNYIATINGQVNSYSHSIAADGGFLEAHFSMAASQTFADDWYENGIGRHIQVFGPGWEQIWEGYVNSVAINMAGLRASRGPLSQVANRVSVVYAEIIDDTADPPIIGSRTETVIAEDTASQEMYGIWEKIISTGNALQTDAEYIRDTYLQENKSPGKDQSFSISGENDTITIDVSCRGYIDFLGNFAYNYTASPLSMEASEKIIDVIQAEPNGVIPFVFDEIDYNGVLVPSYEGDNRLGLTIINDIVSLGDGTDTRWLFGLYSFRKPSYQAASIEVDYIGYLATNKIGVRTPAGADVDPWNILPGRWLLMADFLVGNIRPYDGPEEDSRSIFIEQVNFTAPNQFELQGGKFRRLPQFLAKLGLSGG